MAAAVAPSLDLSSQASFPVRLGSSILQPSESKKFTTVRYNHKPRLNGGGDVKSSISYRSQDGRTLGLSLKDGDSQYKYLGRDVNTEGDDRYVLLPKGSGKNKEMVLEKLSACADFNLVSLMSGTDVRNMKGEYPRLPKDDLSEEQPADGADDLFGESADPSNPFDYRNYLDKGAAKPRPSKVDGPREAANTPQMEARKNPPIPQSKPLKQSDNPLVSQKKRKATESTKSNPKRVKAGEEPPPKPAAPESKPNVPRVRLDRKASLKLPPFEDSGELVVEDETPVQEKPRSAMHLALTGQLGGGPISLHSAANSPAGRAASPGPARPSHVDEDAEFELGGSSPEASQPPSKRPHAGDEDDADVDDLELPSSAQTRQVSSRDVEVVDDEDDLDKQLALAMAEEDDGVDVAMAVQHESEEESEEE